MSATTISPSRGGGRLAHEEVVPVVDAVVDHRVALHPEREDLLARSRRAGSCRSGPSPRRSPPRAAGRRPPPCPAPGPRPGLASRRGAPIPSTSRARLVGTSARDCCSPRSRYPLRSSALRWSFTPLVERMSISSPISRMVGGKPRSSVCWTMKWRISRCRPVSSSIVPSAGRSPSELSPCLNGRAESTLPPPPERTAPPAARLWEGLDVTRAASSRGCSAARRPRPRPPAPG